MNMFLDEGDLFSSIEPIVKKMVHVRQMVTTDRVYSFFVFGEATYICYLLFSRFVTSQ